KTPQNFPLAKPHQPDHFCIGFLSPRREHYPSTDDIVAQNMDRIFFNGWQPLIHIAFVGLTGYVALILFLRLSGKRTLSRMNAYDMVMTMALGSVLTKAMLTQEQSIVETVFAIALLIFFQFTVSFAAFRWRWAAFLAAPSPTVLYHDGRFLQDALRRERVRQS